MTTTKSTVPATPCEERLAKNLEEWDYEKAICEVFFCYLDSKHFRHKSREGRKLLLRHILRCYYNL